MLREIAEGLRVCWRNPILRAMLLRSSTGLFFAGFYSSLYTLFAVRTLGLNAAALGAIVSVGGAASLAGALVSEKLVRRLGIGRALIAAGIVLGLTSLLVPLAHGSVLASAAFLMAAQLGDFAWPVTNVAEISLRQSASPAHLLARVNSAVLLAMRAAVPAGALAAGALAGHIGLRHTMFVGAAGFLLSTLFLIFSPVRRVKDVGALGGPW